MAEQWKSLKSYEIFSKLISFDTTSRNSNLPLIHYIEEYLQQFNITSTLTYDDTKQKANLFATIPPTNPTNPPHGGFILSGHTDVVPIDGQDWHYPPFQLTPGFIHINEENGEKIEKEVLFGRGTSDMKAFIAVSLSFVPDWMKRERKVAIHFAFSYDEEIGCLGVGRLIDEFKLRLTPLPHFCIVGEPTMMQVVTAHKGKSAKICKIKGHSCHSSLMDQGVNSVEIAADLISFIRKKGNELRKESEDENQSEERSNARKGFDPPYSTFQSTVINGGTALNIIPSDCYFKYELRYIPCDDPLRILGEVEKYAREEELPRMKEVNEKTSIEFDYLFSYPALHNPDNSPLLRFAFDITNTNHTEKVSYGTEGGLFQEGGVPTVVIGPGSIEQAHKPDEYIYVDQLEQCEQFMTVLLDKVEANLF